MKINIGLVFGLLIFIISCDKKSKLDPINLDKAVLLQVDYKTYTFEGGKEFGNFPTNFAKTELPVSFTYKSHNFVPGDTGKLTVSYAGKNVFYGIQFWQNDCRKIFPENIDDAQYYIKLDNHLSNIDSSRFEVIYYDLGDPIKYDSIWRAVSKLQMVERYQARNVTAKIGLFLFRPTDGVAQNPGNWKWFVLMRN